MKINFRNIKKRWFLGLIVIVILVGGGWLAFKNGNGDYEMLEVERRDLVETVRVAGRVEAEVVSDLGFPVSGTVRAVLVKVNDRVGLGARLATLDLGTLSADLRAAEADILIKQAEQGNTSVNLEAIEKEYDTLVQSAKRSLLSEGLVAEPSRSSYTQTPPTVSGLYDGPEGTYKIIVKREAVTANDYELRVFDLENPAFVEIAETSATSLGTRGLFIDFPDDLDDYQDTIWYVTIPNKKSSVYLANKNTYDETIRSRNRALEEARNSLRSQSSGTSMAEAELARAQAAADRIRAEIGQRVLTAPFAGTVSAVNIDPGESAGANETAISLISAGQLGVVVDLPEVDSVKVMTGDLAAITIDSIGEDLVLTGKVVSVNRSESLTDGVPVYEARLVFDELDEQIASGMTAEVTITTSVKNNVLALPARAVRYKDDGSTYVVVRSADGKSDKEVDVATGLRSTDGWMEITAGLAGMENVIVKS
ncbi:MAG: hypothetical protein A2589_03295 [Candidatus Vogelbacteria bacterium RIFOXYD1_FULL_46_19]|uniref:RND efflux pump membrane fusion protein barrel-sandwich domain-containing protein n=1 Tax=Candidatus Vogelbacteria bacterium RIFOXYD1_FULL_46_19 TaxID=1802439 RepID=A0A1G2QGY0_9BACT|nr:MAG: hypothetical protein A2589_03295 [Candidatus Vogelbacteria bacterium RIFOXYD1_FULL_46_19]